jgi:hypothetical protein
MNYDINSGFLIKAGARNEIASRIRGTGTYALTDLSR